MTLMTKHFVWDDDPAWPGGIAISAQPVRRVHTRGRRRNTSLVYSTLPLGMRVAESKSEVLFLKVAQLDPLVSRIRAQPCWLQVVEDGKVRRRAPDFAVIYDGGAEMHEVKQDAECLKPDVRSELLAIDHEVTRHHGWRFSVSLESVLRAEPLYSNTELLWRYLGSEYDDGLRLRTMDALAAAPMTAAEAIDRTINSNDDPLDCGSWVNLLSMIADGHVHFDVREPLTLESLIWTRRSGPPRERTLPFERAAVAVKRPMVRAVSAPFCGLVLRGVTL